MQLETLKFFSELVDKLSITANHPEFELIVNRIIQARKELDEAIREAEAENGSD